MLRISWTLTLAVAAMTVVLLGAGRATADEPVCPPGVSYYYAPTVTYYGPPPLYHPLQRVSYYLAQPVLYGAEPPAVSYSAPPAAYYAAPATAVMTTRYGLFGRPWVSTTYYYPR